MNSEVPARRPRIRLLHQMARSGGTIICRCLATMENIVLLSEIHPLGVQMFNPLHQAAQWYGLLNSRDLQMAHGGSLNFVQAIRLIWTRCREQDKQLVLRDWSHLDYTGVPFVRPVFRSLLAEALQSEFELVRFSTVRHPLDQWLSLSRQDVFRKKLGPAKFLRGYNRFAASAAETGFIRYEDFTGDSDGELGRLCVALDLEFDPGYRKRWWNYTNITGDVLPGRAGDTIVTLPRQGMGEAEMARFCEFPEYGSALNRLGYAP